MNVFDFNYNYYEETLWVNLKVLYDAPSPYHAQQSNPTNWTEDNIHWYKAADYYKKYPHYTNHYLTYKYKFRVPANLPEENQSAFARGCIAAIITHNIPYDDKEDVKYIGSKPHPLTLEEALKEREQLLNDFQESFYSFNPQPS